MSEIIEGVINCAQDFKPNIDVERQNDDTGELEPYDGITGVTVVIAAARGSATPIHATLQQDAPERAEYPGRISPTYDVDDLQAYLLPTYRGRVVFLNLIKDGEIFREPIALIVHRDRLGA